MAAKLLNILYLSSFKDDGRGGQKSLLNLISNLDRQAFKAHVVVPAENGSLEKKLKNRDVGVSVIGFPKVLDRRVILRIKAFWNLFNLVSNYQIDIIHTDGPRNTFYAGIVAKLKSIPLIWHVRASNKDQYDRILTKLSSKVILVADALRSRFNMHGNDPKFVTIHNGVELSKFRPQEHDKYVREKYNIDNNELLISVTARVERLKGQKYLIEACGKLKNKIKDFKILLAGEIVELSYLKECQKIADELGIKERLIFSGPLKNVGQILNATDIFVLPSLFEAFPRSVIEAMGAGKPVIVTNVGGCNEAVEDNSSGFIVSAKDSDALAENILLLAQDIKLRDRIGIAARQRASKMFNIKEIVKQTEKLYYEVLKNIK